MNLTTNVFPKITALVVGLNEGDLLARCLNSLQTFDSLIYIDLMSDDDSSKIAQDFGAKLIKHERVPAVEIIHALFIPTVQSDWVLLADPDEVLDEKLVTYLNSHKYILSNPKIGAIYSPCKFYFKGKALRGTPWGGLNKRLLLAHKERMSFTSHVHQGRKLIQSFESYEIEDQNLCVHHYWMQSWSQLFQKHRRYLQLEAKSRLSQGELGSLSKIVKSPLKEFIYSYFACKGYLDGFTGLSLSSFWSWYQTSCQIRLYLHKEKHKS